MSVFPDELYQAPRSWAEQAYPKLIHYNEVDKGGHFAAWEQPELFADEVRAASGRCGEGQVRGSAGPGDRRPPPPLDGATGWLNSPPLAMPVRADGSSWWTSGRSRASIGLRTLGYVRAWAERYRDHGLVVVGVHAPEFPFEGDVENVRRAVTSLLRVPYPVAIDSGYAVWRAFANHYWPAVYIADVEGRIRFHHFGEGDYERSELVIQQLLAEAGADGHRSPGSSQ